MRKLSEKTLQMIADREKGMTYPAIAKKYGVSRQCVQQKFAKYRPGMSKPFTEEQCVYPIWRQWMSDNKVSKSELIRRMGNAPHPALSNRLGAWMRGKGYPLKETIDKLLAATGLTYEQLFYRGDLVNEPTIDAVKVVRCKECTEWDEKESECSHWYGFRENEFCSYGVRRTNHASDPD